MKDSKKSNYLIFIDTETSGFPHDWNTSTKTYHKWPFILQIAWQIYELRKDEEPFLIKNYEAYVKPTPIVDINGETHQVKIDESARLVHGITTKMCEFRGLNRETLFHQFKNDFFRYMPTLVGHCVNFDVSVLSATLHSLEKSDFVTGAPQICTMYGGYTVTQQDKLPTLMELYSTIFGDTFPNYHNASADCEATKQVFFYLLKEKYIILREDGFFDYTDHVKQVLKRDDKW